MLIYHEKLIFFLIFLLSLRRPERFSLLLPPGLNCGNDKSLLPKYEIAEPDFENPKEDIASSNIYVISNERDHGAATFHAFLHQVVSYVMERADVTVLECSNFFFILKFVK